MRLLSSLAFLGFWVFLQNLKADICSGGRLQIFRIGMILLPGMDTLPNCGVQGNWELHLGVVSMAPVLFIPHISGSIYINTHVSSRTYNVTLSK
jgi:hypothetical protein